MKYLHLFSLLILINSSAFAQFREGYVINNDNDTIFGYLNFEGSLLNSKRCEFQTGGELRTFKPGDIKAFRFKDSKYFMSKEIQVDDIPRKVFLEWLIQGRVSLLIYTQSVSVTRYFLLLEDNSLSELTNTTKEIFVGDSPYLQDNKEYIGLLKFYFRDCPSLQDEIETVFFDSKSLISITKDYHERTCETSDCIIFEDKDRKLKFTFGVSANILNSKLLLNNTNPENVHPSNTPGFGLAVSITNLPVLPPRFSARINFMFQKIFFRYDITELQPFITDDRIIRINYLRVPLQLNYNVTKQKLSPYILLGANFNIRLSDKKYDNLLINYLTDESYLLRDERKLKSFQIGINSGAGLNYNASGNLMISLGYEFEYSPRFFGTSVNDYSYNLNNIIQLTAYFKYNSKKVAVPVYPANGNNFK